MKIVLPGVLLLLASCAGTPTGPVRFQGEAMGSGLEIRVEGVDAALAGTAIAAARAEIDRIDRMMTDWKQNSPLMDINRAAGVRPVQVPEELFFLIRRSLQLAKLTEGAFDITWAGAGHLWNWRAREPRVPGADTVRAALANVGSRDVVLDEKARTVFLSRAGMRIGLGGIAPGYAADRAMAVMLSMGVRNAVVNMSGDVLVMSDGSRTPWTVTVEHPRRRGVALATLPVTGGAVSTSGDYEKYFERDGKRYCHIIDPRTGYPADACQSVTVITPTCALADALATALFVLGPERGRALAERMEGVEALIVAGDGTVTRTSGLRR